MVNTKITYKIEKVRLSDNFVDIIDDCFYNEQLAIDTAFLLSNVDYEHSYKVLKFKEYMEEIGNGWLVKTVEFLGVVPVFMSSNI